MEIFGLFFSRTLEFFWGVLCAAFLYQVCKKGAFVVALWGLFYYKKSKFLSVSSIWVLKFSNIESIGRFPPPQKKKKKKGGAKNRVRSTMVLCLWVWIGERKLRVFSIAPCVGLWCFLCLILPAIVIRMVIGCSCIWRIFGKRVCFR